MIRKEYTGGRYVTYTYNAEGQLAKLTYGDGANEKASYLFEYDSLGRLVRSSEAVGNTVKLRTEHIYDGYNRLSKQKWSANGSVYTEYYTYDDGASGDGSLGQPISHLIRPMPREFPNSPGIRVTKRRRSDFALCFVSFV